ncbi:MAG TPA: 2-amino-4-hydroxy-6-hydroxymethyldihydropteridine diphosphokinase [Gammaproteobacteria bacterium]|nr:2-amino-4-hydroxy-6-hydroxymethyldihydropteridine diphosphokinase [Gammaproteobacteria bacterium]
MNHAVRVYIALGSNLNDPRAQVESGLKHLARLPRSTWRGASSLYRTPPMGPAPQPDYINAVAVLDTHFPAHALLDELLAIERAHGRVRGADRWGPRTLDLDILLFGKTILSDARLTLPHPGITERAFVLLPLAELAPDLIVPGKGPLRDLVRACDVSGIERLPA